MPSILVETSMFGWIIDELSSPFFAIRLLFSSGGCLTCSGRTPNYAISELSHISVHIKPERYVVIAGHRCNKMCQKSMPVSSTSVQDGVVFIQGA